MKSAASERQRFAIVSISSKTPKRSSASDQVTSAEDIQPNIHPFFTRLILSNTQPIPSSISSFNQPFIIPSSKQPILTNTNVLTQDSSQVWHSGLSPYPYEIVVLSNNVTVCYGWHSKFLDSERVFPSNLVIKYRNRRITGRRPTGELVVAADYQCTYCHFSKDHVGKMNPVFLFNPTVHISSVFYKQLMQFVEVQQLFHFSSLNIEPQKWNKVFLTLLDFVKEFDIEFDKEFEVLSGTIQNYYF